MSIPCVQTAAGLLLRDGAILLERRPDDAVLTPGVWDSPGGKLEAGETPETALRRELHEELGITVEAARLVVEQDEQLSPTLRCHHFVYVVDAWRGEVAAQNGQQLAWWAVDDVLRAGAECNPLLVEALLQFNGTEFNGTVP